MLKWFFFGALLWVACLPLWGNSSTEFVSFNTGNGALTHNTVEAIVRDNFGYVWVATNYGLNRLDGYQTINYLSDPDDTTTISSNFIQTLFVDSRNDLWIGTIGGGLNKFNRQENNFTRFVPTDTPVSISSLNISAIVEDHRGDVWIGTIGNGVNCYNRATGKFKRYSFEKADPYHRINSNVNRLFCDSDGNIWAGLNQGEVFKIDPLTGEITFFGLKKDDPGYADVGSIKGISQLRNGVLIIAGWNGNIYKMEPSVDSKIELFLGKQFLNLKFLTDITVDQNDNIWVSSWQDGLCKISADLKQRELFRRNQFESNGFGSNSVNILYADDNSNLWIGYTDNGISMLPLGEKNFKSLPIVSSITGQVDRLNVYAIVCDNNHNLWIGTRGQGLVKYDLESGHYKTFLAENTEGLNSNSILTLLVGSDNQIWIGTDGSFICRLDPVTETFTQLENDPNDWSEAVFCLAESDEFIFCGTWGGGIKKVNKKTHQYTTISFDDKDQYRNSIFDIQLKGNTLWVANVGMGLIKYNLLTDEKFVYTSVGGASEFPKERIIDLCFENDSLCWISTDGAGVFRFNPIAGTLESLPLNLPHPGGVIQSTMPDTLNNLWIASISGVTYFNIQTGYSHNFDRNDGLINNQMNKSALFYDKASDIIYTGGVDGVNYFNPYKIKIDSTNCHVIITDLKIMGKSLFPDKKHTQSSVDIAKEVHLFRQDKVMMFYFSSLNFNPSSKCKYFYKLDGFDKEWNETPFSKNFVQYTNLYPGTYFFQVKAVNNDGVLSNQITTLKLIVHPAFWQTPVFWLLIVVVIALVAYIYMRRRHENLLAAKIMLEKKVLERTAEIQQQKEQIEQQNRELEQANRTKDKFFSIISHDLRNPVTSIDQLVELIVLRYYEASEEKMAYYLQILKKTSAGALELLDNLLVWARTQTNRIVLQKTNLEVQELLESVIKTCLPIAVNKDVTIDYPQNVPYSVYVDKNTIQVTLRNLITNAIKFSYPYSTIKVTVEDACTDILFHVSDNGMGMKKEMVEKLFTIENIHSRQGTSGETGTGLGLVLCREFLVLNGGNIWVESEPGVGSTFSFSLQKAQTE